jgi:hypothetical protein
MRLKLCNAFLLTLLIRASADMLAQPSNLSRATKSPPPLVRAHAHNDYEHPRPLLDALDHGFCSIEADIYLVENKLLVAHDRDRAKPERTLQALYLDPLRERVRKHGGRVYPHGPEVVLLVDVKSEAAKTYVALRDVLQEYSDMLTAYRDGSIQTNAITVIVSGNRAPKVMAAETLRYAFIDGRLEDLEGNESKYLIPLISDNWSRIFKWRGNGPMPGEEERRLRQLVDEAHRQGRRLRFWAAPDGREAWQTLLDAGVDLINTDNLEGLQRFFLTR